ncbi:hypothetical protein ACFC14_07640 [Microbacterium sp. NPDC055988]|uniref:hypothetical protein n=1 Tax=Microbacterium sp. NPDC055988 TaxID=3345671 RepID=UPI0035DB824C
MFEHTFFTEQQTRFQQEELERAAARRRMLIERADQIVPRSPGAVRRMLRRIFRAGAGRPVTTRPATAATSHPASVCDRTASVAR